MAEARNFPGVRIPDSIGPYAIVGPPHDSPSYCDYDAIHAVMGHAVLLRHEKWPSTLAGDPEGELLLGDTGA